MIATGTAPLTARFSHGFLPGPDCRLAVMRNSLALDGHRFSNAMMLGLSGTLCFAFAPAEGNRVPFHTILGVSDQGMSRIAAALDGYLVEGVLDGRGEMTTSLVRAHLDAGRPVHVALHQPTLRAIQADRALPDADDPESRFDVGRHWVTLTAYDATDDAFTVFETDDARPFRATSAQLAAAWFRDVPTPRTHADPHQRCHGEWRSLRVASDVRALLPSALVHAIANVAHAFTDPCLPTLGAPALDRFAAVAATWADARFDDDTLAASLVFLPILEGPLTGGGFGRRLYGRFLNEAATLLGDASLREGARLFAESSDLWRKLVVGLRTAVRPVGPEQFELSPAAVRAALTAHLDDAVTAERAQMRWLADWAVVTPVAPVAVSRVA